MNKSAHPAVTFSEALAFWLKLGFISCGGPAGQIAIMHRVLVDEKKWIEESRFLHALNFCVLLPGPEAQKLATYAGWLLHGVRGGLAAGVLFVLPGALVMLALSLAYALGRGIPAVEGALFGIKAAVLVIVVEALLRIGRRALKTRLLISVAAAAFVGFLAAYRDAAPFSPVAAGLLGSALTTWVTFVPPMTLIFAGAPFVEQLRSNQRLSGALAAITAAVVGVILNLTVWFALHVLFGNVAEVRAGPLRWYAFDPLALDIKTAALAALAAVLAFRLHRGLVELVVVMALLGIALRFALPG